MKSNAISKPEGQIYCVGEALWDIVFQNSGCIGGQVGGAMLNSAVTLSRVGLPTNFISLLSSDHAGNAILDFLTKNGIQTDYLIRNTELQTTLALAFINQSGDAEYSFYKDSLPEFEFKIPRFTGSDILLFGSGWAREKLIFPQLQRLLTSAKEASSIIIYDPNFRKKDSCTPSEVLKMCTENIAVADIVRGSDEDFFNLFGCKDSITTWNKVQKYGCEYLIYTSSDSLVECYFGNKSITIPIEKVAVVNTVGAGDNFNAGIITAFYQGKIRKSDLPVLDVSDWRLILNKGRSFGSAVCTVKESYLSKQMIKMLSTAFLFI